MEEGDENKVPLTKRELGLLLSADRKLYFLVVSNLFDISDFLGRSENSIGTKYCCPFHHDDTPSAKLFKDDDGFERLYCFSCRKQFTSYHYISKVLNEYPLSYLFKNSSPQEIRSSIIRIKKNTKEEKKVSINYESYKDILKEEGVGAYIDCLYSLDENDMNYPRAKDSRVLHSQYKN